MLHNLLCDLLCLKPKPQKNLMIATINLLLSKWFQLKTIELLDQESTNTSLGLVGRYVFSSQRSASFGSKGMPLPHNVRATVLIEGLRSLNILTRVWAALPRAEKLQLGGARRCFFGTHQVAVTYSFKLGFESRKIAQSAKIERRSLVASPHNSVFFSICPFTILLLPQRVCYDLRSKESACPPTVMELFGRIVFPL